MPQKRIPLKPGQMYHIWTHANGSENLIRSNENYRYFLEKYSYHAYPVVQTFAYCLMPNHLHLMIRVKGEKVIVEFVRRKKEDPTLQGFETLGGFNIVSQQFSNLFNSYTQAYNRMYNRKGSLFIPNFNRKPIDSQYYFTRLIAYIHNNPVHHGFVDHPRDWPFSSLHIYLHDEKTKLNKTEGLALFGNRKVFEVIHRKLKPEKLIPLFEYED